MVRDATRLKRRSMVVAVAVLATVYLLVAAATQLDLWPIWDVLFQTVPLWFLTPGAILVLRRDGHVIGWLLVGGALLWAVQLSTENPGAGLAWLPVPWLAWIFDWVGYAQWTATIALFVLFPNGMADRSPGQRRAGWAMIGAGMAVTALAMLLQLSGRGSPYGLQPNPTPLGVLPVAFMDYLIAPVLLAGLSSVVALWRRARRVGGAERRQYTWVLFSFAVVVAGLVVGLALGGVVGDAAWLLIVAGWFLIPTTISVAILRHRLYDIDRIVSRTLAYGLTTAAVAAVYTLPVIALPELFGARGPVPVAAATLAAAAAFAPVRRTVQQWVDRHFNRARFDARRELEAFAANLRSEVDIDAIVGDIHRLVDTTLQPTVATTWIRLPRGSGSPRPAS